MKTVKFIQEYFEGSIILKTDLNERNSLSDSFYIFMISRRQTIIYSAFKHSIK